MVGARHVHTLCLPLFVKFKSCGLQQQSSAKEEEYSNASMREHEIEYNTHTAFARIETCNKMKTNFDAMKCIAYTGNTSAKEQLNMHKHASKYL